MSRGLLGVICIVLVICFAVAYADLYHRYQGERQIRILTEALAESRKQDSEHYWQLYVDCHYEEESAPPWAGLANK